MLFKPGVKAPPGYGTAEFYRKLDANAPAERSGQFAGAQRTGYNFITVYPLGYYSALAMWLKVVSGFSDRISVLFFGARIFSVLLLVVSLILCYSVCRELRIGPRRALVLTAIVGAFPMTTFVSSYVQADNLSLTVVLLCCYLALLFRRKDTDARLLMMLGMALALLFLTKYHFYCVVFLVVLPMLLADKICRRHRNIGWARLLAWVLVPTVMAVLIQVWVTHTSNMPSLGHNPSTNHEEILRAAASGKWAVVSFLFDGAGQAFSNFYLNVSKQTGVSTCATFWGCFGWVDAPLIIMSPAKTEIINDVIALFNVIVFALTLIRLQQVATRLILIARRGRWRTALSITFSNPLLNAYFVFTVLMFGLFMVVRKSFAPQGRNWFPFILPIFVVGAQYASKALSHRLARRGFAAFILACLLLYSVVGSYYAIRSINDRYYGPAMEHARFTDSQDSIP
jgi:4-amino-4-deoxy-L-arabinose transferase-like glycosyltransferase